MKPSIDEIAEVQHEIWVHWMNYLFEVSRSNLDGSVTIPADKVLRWKKQILTDYNGLSLKEQEGDLEQAKKILDLIILKADKL